MSLKKSGWLRAKFVVPAGFLACVAAYSLYKPQNTPTYLDATHPQANPSSLMGLYFSDNARNPYWTPPRKNP